MTDWDDGPDIDWPPPEPPTPAPKCPPPTLLGWDEDATCLRHGCDGTRPAAQYRTDDGCEFTMSRFCWRHDPAIARIVFAAPEVPLALVARGGGVP